ncbi:MAG: hypothetical protein KDB03_13960 [Planctomycetales bacterium]|nr:hypothetical protein [Planctomycetales bacterium]
MTTWISKLGYAGIGVGLVCFGMATSESYSQVGTNMLSAGTNLQVLSANLPSGIQQVVVVDSELRTMAVYQIDPVQGKIQLKSARNVAFDLRLDEFNAMQPLPSELRAVAR